MHLNPERLRGRVNKGLFDLETLENIGKFNIVEFSTIVTGKCPRSYNRNDASANNMHGQVTSKVTFWNAGVLKQLTSGNPD